MQLQRQVLEGASSLLKRVVNNYPSSTSRSIGMDLGVPVMSLPLAIAYSITTPLNTSMIVQHISIRFLWVPGNGETFWPARTVAQQHPGCP